MKNKFTPGPWIIEEHGSVKYIVAPSPNTTDDDVNVTICQMATDEDTDATDHDTRLVAAAPEILEALENLIQALPLDVAGQDKLIDATLFAVAAVHKAKWGR